MQGTLSDCIINLSGRTSDILHVVLNSCFSAFSLCMLILISTVGFKVYQLVRLREKVISLLILFLCFTWVSEIVFYTLNAYQVWTNPDDEKDPNSTFIFKISIVMNLSIAITINLRNWVFYYIKIGEMAYHQQYSDSEQPKLDWYLSHVHRHHTQYTYLTNGVAISIILTTISVYTWITVIYIQNNQKT